MKTVIFCIVAFLSLPVLAIDYNDFPPALQQILDQRTDELASKGEIFVAGNVTASDGAYFGSGKELAVNFYQWVDAPLEIYDSGWFIMKRALEPMPDDDRPTKLILRAFGYDPIDTTFVASKGKVTYAEFEMKKTPAEDLATITGTVTYDDNEPAGGVNIYLVFPHAYTEEHPQMTVITEPNGRYLFENLSATEYHLYIMTTPEHAGASANITPAKGKTTIKDIALYPNLKIVIDYVYQADGSRNFAGGDLQTGTIEWVNGSDGIDFSDGRVEGYEQESTRDIDMWQAPDGLRFNICYGNAQQKEQQNGYYDAGIADFNSVTEASETGYWMDRRPCKVGHTYVVRTFEGNYAKFVVRDIFEE
ncbi:MAG: carboxypeptidase-like regulatory domain-containing protein [Phycisphaerae bacterium]|nr:carboxypeptidase-like regulatory domain-containing protein [Phycisphaerae bacterium]MDD5380504.1 carboxypeptidase-like regulatory domain-containing protein [Phycisphaerae bacterium]